MNKHAPIIGSKNVTGENYSVNGYFGEIETRKGLRQLSAMRELKMGNPQYELIEID